jgi:aromatic-L-amino-acid decarboxylase
MAPTPLSVVCFRFNPKTRAWSNGEIDAANERLMEAVNATGEVFISHTKLRNALTLRLAIGHLRTAERHVARAWELLQQHAALIAR